MRIGTCRCPRGAVSYGLILISLTFLSGPAHATELLISPTGQSPGDIFGTFVGNLGDFNDDGFDDVIIGATRADVAGMVDVGAAYVYFGGPAADGIPDFTFIGEAPADDFGHVSPVPGDFNGDGYPDALVGAYRNDAGGDNAGRAYVYFGGPSADAVADVVFTGLAEKDTFGEFCSFAGDVNGDGYDDVLVGADQASASEPGAAYIFFGDSLPDAIADLTFSGENVGDNFGFGCRGAGDLNDDGFDDWIIGARLHSSAGTGSGRAYVYLGGPSPDTVADLILDGEAAEDRFGRSVGAAGDVNGDGFGDWIVGARNNDQSASNAGRATVYFGGPVLDGTADLVLTGENSGDRFGTCVVGAGDCNADGFDDVIVSASNNNDGGINAGKVYVYFGGSTPDAVADLTFIGSGGDYLGFGYPAVGSAGDFDRDGAQDMVMGAPYDDGGGIDAGRAFVYSIPQPLEVTFGDSWDGISLQDVLDAEYGVGVIDAATDYEGYTAGDADPPYWKDVGMDGIIVREIAGFHRTNTMGWHEEDFLLPVIDGVDDGVVFTGPMEQGESVTIDFPAGLTRFGFYLNPNGTGDANNAPEPELFFVNRFFNDVGPDGSGAVHPPDTGDPQCLVYDITRLRSGVPTFVLAWEDLDYGGDISPSSCSTCTDNDFQDLVVEITAISPVPAVSITLHATEAAEGIQLRWSLRSPLTLDSLALIRSASDGSRSTVMSWDRNRASATDSWIDDHVIGGQRYSYQLEGEVDGMTVLSNQAAAELRAGLPARSRLLEPVPNPFNPATRIRFLLDTRGGAALAIYDVAGRLVRHFDLDPLAVGEGSVVWNGLDDAGRPVASGSYLLRLVTPDSQDQKRVTLLK